MVFLEEAALKITFVRVKTLTVLTVLQGKKKKREANDAQISPYSQKKSNKARLVSQRAQDFQRLGVINTVFASNKKYRKIPKISLSSQARKVKKKNPPLHRHSEYKSPGAYTWKFSSNTGINDTVTHGHIFFCLSKNYGVLGFFGP